MAIAKNGFRSVVVLVFFLFFVLFSVNDAKSMSRCIV